MGSKIPGLSKIFETPNPKIAALLQAPAVAPAITSTVTELIGAPVNVAIGLANNEIGNSIFGGVVTSNGTGSQSLPAFVTPDPTAGGLFANPNSFKCFACIPNDSSGGSNLSGGKLKY